MPGFQTVSVECGISKIANYNSSWIDNCLCHGLDGPKEQFQCFFSYHIFSVFSSRLFLTPTRLLGEVLRRTDQLSHMMSPGSHPEFVQVHFQKNVFPSGPIDTKNS